MRPTNAPPRAKAPTRPTSPSTHQALKHAQGEQLRMLNLISRAVTTSLAPDDVISAALDALVGLGQADTAFLWRRENRRLILAGERRSETAAGENALAPECNCCWGRVAVRDQRPTVARRGRGRTNLRKECITAGIRSCLSLPLLSASQKIGALTLATRQPHLYADRIGFWETVAGQIAAALQNALLYRELTKKVAELDQQTLQRVRAEQAQLEIEARFRTFVENSWDTFVTLNAEGVVLYASPSIRRYGYEADQLVGRHLVDFIHPSQAEMVTQRHAELIEQPGKTIMLQAQVRRADGTFAWMEGIATNIIHAAEIEAVILDCRDVTDRIRTEHELVQYAKEQATLYEIALRLNSESTLPGLLQTIVELGAKSVHAQAGAIFRYDPELNVLRLDTGAGFAAEYLGWMSEPGHGIVGKVWATRAPEVVQDYAAWDERAVPFSHDERVKVVLAVPLVGPRGPLGVLLVNRSAPDRKFTERDVRLMEMLSAQASLTIENALFYQQEHHHRELAETLREVGAVLTATLDPQLVLDNIMAQVGRLVPHDAANIMHIEDGFARVVRRRGYERFGTSDLQELSAELEDNSLWRDMDITGKPIVLADTRESAKWNGAPDMLWVRSFLGAPIRVRNQTIGFLNVHSETPNFFTAEHVVRLQALANQAAIALANAELFEKARVAAERLQALSHRLVQTQEMERSRIAFELHDEMGQALTAQMVDLLFCEQHVQEPDAVAARLAVLKRSTDNVLENLHRLTVDLRPVALDHLGLVAALRQYVQSFCQQHSEIQVQFQVIGMGEERQPTETETALYRITQESLTNVARHAHATRVEVMIARRGEKIILMCWDNGVGFDPRGVGPNERMGLTSMRERASMLGGFVWIDSELGVGTTVHVEVPFVNSTTDR